MQSVVSLRIPPTPALMLLDARPFDEGTRLDADICIIGAGVAGLVLATELSARGRNVLLLDSGGTQVDVRSRALNQGDIVGDEYRSLQETRHRQLGGTAMLWNTPVGERMGAKYAPLDAVDLQGRSASSVDGRWPFSWDDLGPWYARAQRICGLGPFDYDAAHSPLASTIPFPAAGELLVPRLYHLGAREALVDSRVQTLAASSDPTVCAHATAVRLELDRQRQRMTALHAASPGGARWSVHAQQFVLAAGAIENARLLLCAADGERAPGNHAGWVGRCFMEHPRDVSLTLRPRSASAFESAAFYDVHRCVEGHAILGRIAFSPASIVAHDLLNGSITLFPIVRDVVLRARSLLRPLTRFAYVERLLPAGGHGWSRHPHPRRVFDGFLLRMNLEQTPHPENRVELGSRCDALGVRQPVLHWRWRDDDRARLARLHARIVEELETFGVGAVTRRHAPPDPHAHHHAGTTRMHRDPQFGVVNEDCRVHGVDNLFIAGASVFPSAGFANPVLTAVALAARLAERLS